jgi:tetratricopeptide (TPR) repeat protein
MFESEVDPDTIRQLISELIENRKFEEAIDCIQQAILSGQIQPWMHQVLALSMMAAGRPKASVERVLLSSQDLISNDPSSMMTLAACLVQFGQSKRAIELYRQAAALNPSRPEPYVLGLELAARTKNYEAVLWSAPEVLAYSWSGGREHLNLLAERAAAEAIESSIKTGNFALAYDLQAAMKQARRIDLAVRLEWNGQGDLDLQVIEPSGSICSSSQPMTAAGGIYVHDGFGPNQNNCYEEYLCPQGLQGEYRAVVRHVSGNITSKRARLVIVRDRGTAFEEAVTETLFLGTSDQVVRLSLNHGRRRIANAEQQSLESNSPTKPSGQSNVLAQFGNAGAAGPVGGLANAVGFTPLVTMVNEGVQMSAMAVVSGDRRYVRINAAPIFSTITDVFSFTYSR